MTLLRSETTASEFKPLESPAKEGSRQVALTDLLPVGRAGREPLLPGAPASLTWAPGGPLPSPSRTRRARLARDWRTRNLVQLGPGGGGHGRGRPIPIRHPEHRGDLPPAPGGRGAAGGLRRRGAAGTGGERGSRRSQNPGFREAAQCAGRTPQAPRGGGLRGKRHPGASAHSPPGCGGGGSCGVRARLKEAAVPPWPARPRPCAAARSGAGLGEERALPTGLPTERPRPRP